ncbi:MAG: hypothetical protein K2L42_02605 [Clostridia bacterium]|nr:hypothetical protein [Clostridia bacterium]
MKRKIGYICLCLSLVAFGAAIIIHPERYVNCCFQGFAMWAECVLPSLFPFMVITLIAVKSGIAEKAALPLKKVTKKIKLPPAAASCFILSICSGYPAGSKVVSEFYESGVISKRDCAKVAYLCSTSGPLFIVGSVGFKMFADKTAGVKILLAHLFSVTVISLLISLFSKSVKTDGKKHISADENVLYNTFYGAVTAVTVAGGFIAFFYVVATFCADFSLLYPLEKFLSLMLDGQTSSAVCLGLVEATTGCRALSATGGKLSVALAGFLITFGGFSILLQQLCYLTKAGVKPLKFVAVKFIQALLCFAVLLLIA